MKHRHTHVHTDSQAATHARLITDFSYQNKKQLWHSKLTWNNQKTTIDVDDDDDKSSGWNADKLDVLTMWSNNHRNNPIQNKRSRRQIVKQEERNKTTLRELTIPIALLPNSLTRSFSLSFLLSHNRFISLPHSLSFDCSAWRCRCHCCPFFQLCLLFTLAIFTAHK